MGQVLPPALLGTSTAHGFASLFPPLQNEDNDTEVVVKIFRYSISIKGIIGIQQVNLAGGLKML